MPLEGRRRQMVEQSRETPAEHGSGEPVETKLLRIAAKARKERKLKFVNLYHLMNEEMLLECFNRLSGNKAAGIDEVTKAEYGENLEANIKELVGRLHRMAYRPRPVRRVYGVTDNYRGIARFHREVTKVLFKWLNRRSQRRSYRWDEFEQLLKIFPLPQPRVRVQLFYRARKTV
jgi:hypothetical protein